MQKKPPKRTRVLKVEGNIQEDKSKMGGWHKFLRYFVCVSADVSIPQKPERGRGGQPFSVKVSPLGSASFGRLFKNNSKASSSRMPRVPNIPWVSFPHYLKGEECRGSTCSAQYCSSCAEADKWSARPSSPSALRRHAESMKRLGDYASPGACLQRARG